MPGAEITGDQNKTQRLRGDTLQLARDGGRGGGGGRRGGGEAGGGGGVIGRGGDCLRVGTQNKTTLQTPDSVLPQP